MHRGVLDLVLLSLLAAGPTPVLKGCGGGGMGRMEGGPAIGVTPAGGVEFASGMRRSQMAQEQFGWARQDKRRSA